jgi:hypothetical protein
MMKMDKLANIYFFGTSVDGVLDPEKVLIGNTRVDPPRTDQWADAEAQFNKEVDYWVRYGTVKSWRE